MSSPISTLRTRATVVLALSGATLLADPAAPPPPAVRPAVVLLVRLDASVYRIKLGSPDCLQPCQTLQTRLAESFLSVLQRDLAFVQWTGAGTAAPDTLVLTWSQVNPASHSEVNLDVALQGPRFAQSRAQLRLQFEKWAQAFVRPSYADTALLRVWPDTVADRLRTNADGLMDSVFARLPLTAKVVLDRSRAKVPVSPDTIRATPDERHQPQFLVRTMVQATEVIGTETTGTMKEFEVILHACTWQPPAYVCDVGDLRSGSQTFPPSKLAELMSSATVTQKSLHLWRYRPAPGERRTDGTLNAPNP